MRSAMNLAVIKDRFAVTENEIDIALDIAVGKVLASGNAGLAVGSAVATAGVERVLIAEKANVAEDGTIGSDQHRQRLRPDGDLGVGGVPVVGEGEVLGAEVVAAYLGSGRVQCASGSAGTLIESDDGLGSVRIAAAEFDVWLSDRNDLAIGAGRDEQQCAVCGSNVQSFLNGVEISTSIRRHVERVIDGGCGSGGSRGSRICGILLEARLARQRGTGNTAGLRGDGHAVSGEFSARNKLAPPRTKRDVGIRGVNGAPGQPVGKNIVERYAQLVGSVKAFQRDLSRGDDVHVF